MKNIFALKLDQPDDHDQQVEEGNASPTTRFRSGSALGANQARGSVNVDKINAAIDEWAESLIAIIEASDHPEASLLRAHLAIAIKHKEFEKMARRELETRLDRGVPNG
jgi:hypothetical protein